MASYDNEIYRGPPEAGPTLERDIRSYGSDVYIVNTPQTTLEQDVPATEEPIRQESKPVQKKESKIAKAMKLLASCTAAAAIAVNLTAPPPSPPPAEEPIVYENEWPRFSQTDGNLNGYALSTPSQHGNMVQVSTGSKTYRITAKQEDLHLFWTTTYNIEHNPNREGFNLMIENWNEGWFLDVSFHLYPQTGAWIENELMSQFTTPSGETFYLRAFLPDGEESTKERTTDIMARLSDYLEFSEATEDGWGKVLVGNTMCSDTSAQWNGIMTTPDVSPDFCFSRINYRQYAEYSEDQFIRSLTINDIEWSFYYSFDEYSLLLWAAPSQEDIVLASGLDFIVDDMGLTVQELAQGSPEINAELMDRLGIAVELAAKNCFSNYHLYDNPPPSPSDPVNPPDAPDTPPVPPDTTPDGPVPTAPAFTGDYFTGLDFSFGGHSFRMDALRNDVSFRQIDQFDDCVVFDFRADDENLRVPLVISSIPSDGVQDSYYLTNGTELFVAAISNLGEPWTADEQTLAALVQNLSAYVYIDETTDPYSYLPEFRQYEFQGGISYNNHARSHRICQFVTERGEYRLEAQTPDLFIFWERYNYFSQDKSEYSMISIRHHKEDWTLDLAVFDQPVDLDFPYGGFSLTSEDGTELWFYEIVGNSFEQDHLQSIISRLPKLVKLSAAQDDGWGKFRIGETVIVNQTPYWSGMEYTDSGDTFWRFHNFGHSSWIAEYDLRFAGTREVNGIQWDFYTTGSVLRDGSGKVVDGVYQPTEIYLTNVYAVAAQEDIYLNVELETYHYKDGGLSLPKYEFSSRAEYDACLDANIGSIIDTIVSQGLSNFYPYSE